MERKKSLTLEAINDGGIARIPFKKRHAVTQEYIGNNLPRFSSRFIQLPPLISSKTAHLAEARPNFAMSVRDASTGGGIAFNFSYAGHIHAEIDRKFPVNSGAGLPRLEANHLDQAILNGSIVVIADLFEPQAL